MSFAEAIRQLLDLFQEAFADKPVLSEGVLDALIEKFWEKLPINYRQQLTKAVA